MRSLPLSLVLFLTIVFPVISQDSESTEEATEAAETTEEETTAQDLVDLQRDILRYGITSEVVDLLETLETERDERLAGEVAELLEGEVPVDIRVAAFEYFDSIGSDEGVPAGQELLPIHEELPDRLLLSVLRYLRSSDANISEDAVEPLKQISLSSDREISRQAFRLLGVSEHEAAVDYLVEVGGSLEEEQHRREAALLALGDAAEPRAVETLTTILTDRAEEPTLRWYAADALGKIGDPESVAVLERQLDDADTWFRAYLIGALGRYEGRVDEEIFVRALRDDFWRVRVSALETLGRRRVRSAFEAMAYRARRDPVNDVRAAAFEALGELQTNEAKRFLVEYAEDTGNPGEHRGTAARVLVEDYMMQGRGDIEELLEQEWSTEDSPVLSSMVATLSRTEESMAGPLLVKLLEHPDPGVQSRALMGMRSIGAAQFRSEIEGLAEESPHGSVRRQAEMALEDM